MSKHFLTSDLHLLHTNIIRYCDRKDYYPGTDEDCFRMSWDIVNSINRQIPDEENIVLWNLGDLFYGPLFTAQNLDALKSFVTTMKGSHRALNIVLGNHDKQFTRFANWKLWQEINNRNTLIEIFKFLGFDSVYREPYYFTENIIFSHEPVFIKPGQQLFNIHGHTHNFNVEKDYFMTTLENAKMIKKAFLASDRPIPEYKEKPDKENWIIEPKNYKNISWDANQRNVVSLEEIIKDIEK